MYDEVNENELKDSEYYLSKLLIIKHISKLKVKDNELDRV